jgi:hypothetical protein
MQYKEMEKRVAEYSMMILSKTICAAKRSNVY